MVTWMMRLLKGSALFSMMLLTGCSNGGTVTGHNELPSHLLEAKAAIKPYYPEATTLPIVIENHNDLSRAMSYGNGRIYVASGLIDEVNTGVFANREISYQEGVQLLGCYLVHEWGHHQGMGESGSYALTAECLRTLGADPYWVDRYQARV